MLTSDGFRIKPLSFYNELQNTSVEFREAVPELCSRLIALFKIESLHNLIACQSQCNVFNTFGND